MIIYKILLVIFSYLLGAVPTGYIIFRLKTRGGDIRQQGSGNVGGTNVTRTIGVPLGVLTIIIDILKGFIPLLVIYLLFKGDLVTLSAAAVAAVLGHDYPVYLKFRGGKGISTSYGVIIGLCCFAVSEGHSIWVRLIPVLAILVTWSVVFLISKIVSLSSLLAAVATPVSFYLSGHSIPVVIAAICLFVLTFIAHRDNIKRLIRKEEKKLKGKGA
ncbi:MAG: glycerol-3-phosphate 1-O-acyltransferase PlsY [Actinobacteria bacterium]|nr:glycerol-3-phosphate 1-O-acyltransferase PlsY [Actinomycetota bacterium]